MKKKDIIFLSIVVVLFAVGSIFVLGNRKDPVNINSNGGQVATTTSSTVSIEDYITKNISILSPEKEVLGGIFYITHIEATNGKGTVSYEDGHNAFTADFVYTIGSDGNPHVTSFVVRK